MLDFIVLGYIPGTSTQITFTGFLQFVIVLIGLVALPLAIRFVYTKFGTSIMLYNWYAGNWLRGTIA